LMVTPVGGSTVPGAITFSVTGLPLHTTVSFTPAQIAAGSGTTSVTAQVNLEAHADALPLRRPFPGGALPVALGLLLLPFAGKFRKSRRRLYGLVALAVTAGALALGVTGCGGSSSIKAQSYTITVTAASGALSHSATVQLTVR